MVSLRNRNDSRNDSHNENHNHHESESESESERQPLQNPRHTRQVMIGPLVKAGCDEESIQVITHLVDELRKEELYPDWEVFKILLEQSVSIDCTLVEDPLLLACHRLPSLERGLMIKLAQQKMAEDMCLHLPRATTSKPICYYAWSSWFRWLYGPHLKSN